MDVNELFKSYAPGAVVNLLMQSDGDIVTRKLKLGQGDPLINNEEADVEGDADEQAKE